MPESRPTGSTVIRRSDSLLLTLVLLSLSGAAWLLSWPPIDLWPMSFLWAALLIRAAIGARHAWLLSVACLLIYVVCWGWLLRWSSNVSVAGYPAMVIYSAVWMVFFALLLRRLEHRRPLLNCPLAITAPITWIALEYLRAEILFGAWPWYLAGHPLIEWPVICQVADLGGVWLVSMLVLCIGAAGAEWMRPHPRSGQAMTSSILAACALLISIGWGVFSLAHRAEPVMGRFLLVQTNVPQDNKLRWTIEEQVEDLGSFMELTAGSLKSVGGADVVIWPESMVPGIGFDESMHESLKALNVTFSGLPSGFWRDQMRTFSNAIDTPMIIGTNTWAGELDVLDEDSGGFLDPEWQFNSVVLLEPAGVQPYHKIFPTPFGERLPWIDAWPWLRAKLLALGASGLSLQLDAGPPMVPIELTLNDGTAYRLATPICFESTVPSITRDLVREREAGLAPSDLIVNISNDGWFGNVDGGRLSHAQAARFRCIELRRPMLRCANTGQTAWFDSAGRVVDSLPLQEAGSMLAEPRLDSRRTLYGMIGNLVPVMCLVFIIMCFLVSFEARRLKR
ncbi:MAG: apolipoprotein N-acyltransferase [Planctomycetota bacterium]|nr:apolipoprotein N-acyltransferase [Planctomycetota bacterium]